LAVGRRAALAPALRCTDAAGGRFSTRLACSAGGFEPASLLKNQSEIYPGDPASEFQPPSERARQFRVVRSEHVETFPDACPQQEGTAAAAGALVIWCDFGAASMRRILRLKRVDYQIVRNVITIGLLLIGNGINAHRAIDDDIASFDECFPYQRWLTPLGSLRHLASSYQLMLGTGVGNVAGLLVPVRRWSHSVSEFGPVTRRKK
jgi:hypothetical protein